MRRCLQLATNGRLTAAPNPMVGAVLVHDGKIIGEGWHHSPGNPHAEVNAINDALKKSSSSLSSSSLYVNLEPCCHYGKTPPCADLIIKMGIPRVVVGAADSNSKVNGGGIQKLHDAGVEVVVGVLEEECRELNKVFYCNHEKHRPFITLKWAETNDGVIGIIGEKLQISNPFTQMLCHKRRAEHEAILVGRRTWENDKPQLNVRLWAGKDPEKIVLSHQLISEQEDLSSVISHLSSILVEGGKETLQYFIDNDLWDECYVEKNTLTSNLNTLTSNIITAPTLKNAKLIETNQYGTSMISKYIRI